MFKEKVKKKNVLFNFFQMFCKLSKLRIRMRIRKQKVRSGNASNRSGSAHGFKIRSKQYGSKIQATIAIRRQGGH